MRRYKAQQKLAGKEINQNKVPAKIMEIKFDFLDLKSFFEQKGLWYAVHNTVALSLAETRKNADRFATLSIKLVGLFCNHRTRATWIKVPPYSAHPLVGLDTLTHFTSQSGLDLAGVLKKSITRQPFQCPGRS